MHSLEFRISYDVWHYAYSLEGRSVICMQIQYSL